MRTASAAMKAVVPISTVGIGSAVLFPMLREKISKERDE